jgi:hypothetical protein
MQQKELQQMTKTSQAAAGYRRWQPGDADLHAREDLLLDHYSSSRQRHIRIPIDARWS